jgi:hypothetical protein
MPKRQRSAPNCRVVSPNSGPNDHQYGLLVEIRYWSVLLLAVGWLLPLVIQARTAGAGGALKCSPVGCRSFAPDPPVSHSRVLGHFFNLLTRRAKSKYSAVAHPRKKKLPPYFSEYYSYFSTIFHSLCWALASTEPIHDARQLKSSDQRERCFSPRSMRLC